MKKFILQFIRGYALFGLILIFCAAIILRTDFKSIIGLSSPSLEAADQRQRKESQAEADRALRAASQPEASQPEAFSPGVEGRGSDEVCQSTSPECQQWTELARKCEDNLRKRDAGDMSPQQPYCTQAEELRERATGVPLSSDPGAYNF